MTPSLARIDAEYAQYAEQLAADSAKEAKECIDSLAAGVEVNFHKVAHRSASGGLLEAIDELEAEVLVLGSAADGKLGQVVVGLDGRSAAALFAGSAGHQPARLPRVESRWPDPDHRRLPGHSGERCTSWNALRRLPNSWMSRCGWSRSPCAAARCIRRKSGCAPRTRSSKPWAAHAREALAELKTDGIVGDDVDLQVVTGNGWDQAIDAADWQDGDLLAIGTSPSGGIARVFLGSRGSKILRHSPVPVLVLPRLVLRRAAVDGDLAARDRRRPVAGQPGHHVGNLFGRHEFLQPLLALVVDRVERHRREAVQITRILGEDRPSSPPSPPSACRSSTGESS